MYGKNYERQKPGDPIKASTINRPLAGLEAVLRARFAGRLHQRTGPGGIPLVDDGGLQETVRTFRSPAGGIPAKVGNTSGSATCTRYVSNLADQPLGTETETVYNDAPSAVGANLLFKAHWEGNGWRFLVQVCP